MPKKLTREEFIERARAIHGDKYNYDKVVYVNNATKVVITCPTHGDFLQKPSMHLSGNGCPECYGRTRKNTVWFIKRAKMIHGERYDYSKSEYTTANKKVCIICKEHGEFWQEASQHLRGHGCPQCYYKVVGERNKQTQEDFVRRAIEVHGQKYDYGKVNYKGMNDKVCIICPIHGEFWQFARTHVCEKRGCEKCSHDNQKTLVYGIGVNDGDSEGKTPAFKAWSSMLQRCYGNYGNHPTYEDCVVCYEWLTFSNFKEWFENPENGYMEGYHLDKDILNKHNRIYSPSTCCLVPRYINELFVKTDKARGKYPIGVFWSKAANKFVAKISKNNVSIHLGVFLSPEEAFLAYKEAKETYIKEIASEYFNQGKITKRVYDAMCNYVVEITD